MTRRLMIQVTGLALSNPSGGIRLSGTICGAEEQPAALGGLARTRWVYLDWDGPETEPAAEAVLRAEVAELEERLAYYEDRLDSLTL